MKQCRQWQACDAGTEEGAAGREALLSRLVEQLKGRLQALKEENQQLEDMLHQSDSRASGMSSTTAYSLYSLSVYLQSIRICQSQAQPSFALRAVLQGRSCCSTRPGISPTTSCSKQSSTCLAISALAHHIMQTLSPLQAA